MPGPLPPCYTGDPTVSRPFWPGSEPLSRRPPLVVYGVPFVGRDPNMTGILALAEKRMSDAGLVDALLFVAIIVFSFAGSVMWMAARSHANRDKRGGFPQGDFGLPSYRWPWVLPYVFLAIAGLLFFVGRFLWR